ncbi:hypothetical protein H5410_050519 [Solanum commersonii]|uniref:Uncharacterized protein n=1 Tax=Solanum commersonii TaxID=4109 RepID=A0A9J5WXU1_SOLCO|nr:hypothetical protein H5410_050519 [Solanum commersonii]
MCCEERRPTEMEPQRDFCNWEIQEMENNTHWKACRGSKFVRHIEVDKGSPAYDSSILDGESGGSANSRNVLQGTPSTVRRSLYDFGPLTFINNSLSSSTFALNTDGLHVIVTKRLGFPKCCTKAIASIYRRRISLGPPMKVTGRNVFLPILEASVSPTRKKFFGFSEEESKSVRKCIDSSVFPIYKSDKSSGSWYETNLIEPLPQQKPVYLVGCKTFLHKLFAAKFAKNPQNMSIEQLNTSQISKLKSYIALLCKVDSSYLQQGFAIHMQLAIVSGQLCLLVGSFDFHSNFLIHNILSYDRDPHNNKLIVPLPSQIGRLKRFKILAYAQSQNSLFLGSGLTYVYLLKPS